MNTNKLFLPREIGVCGSSRELPREAVAFCKALGHRLALDPAVIIVSGGTKHRNDAEDKEDRAAEWHIVETAREFLSAQNPTSVWERIVTVPRAPSDTDSFSIGRERPVRGKTSEARRIAFVRDVDALIAVCGGGTDQELALAIELHIPVLPVPSFPGKARWYWQLYRPELIEALRIDEKRAGAWEAPTLTSPESVEQLANEMVAVLLNSLPRRCFVIMPFAPGSDSLYDGVIKPAVTAEGDIPVRVDRTAQPGDVIRQIHDGIKNCEYVIAVLDDLRANVLYELGLAHAREKPTIIGLCRTASA